MKILPPPAASLPAPQQLSIAFDSARVRGMTPTQRRIALAKLALLLAVANAATGERDDDDR